MTYNHFLPSVGPTDCIGFFCPVCLVIWDTMCFAFDTFRASTRSVIQATIFGAAHKCRYEWHTDMGLEEKGGDMQLPELLVGRTIVFVH